MVEHDAQAGPGGGRPGAMDTGDDISVTHYYADMRFDRGLARRALDNIRYITRATRDVLACYIAHADRAGNAWPSLRTVAREAHCAKSTAERAVRTLVNACLLVATGKRHGTAIEYRLMIPGAYAPARGGLQWAGERVPGALLTKWRQEWGFVDDVIKLALERAATADHPLAYADRVLAEWRSKDVVTVDDAYDAIAAHDAHRDRQRQHQHQRRGPDLSKIPTKY